MERVTFRVPEPASEIAFMGGQDWIMRITQTDQGPIVEFNTQKYPNALPDDFAKAFGEIVMKAGYLDQFMKGKSD